MTHTKLTSKLLGCLLLLLMAFAVNAQQGNTTRYVYDNNGRLRAVLAPSGEAAVYDYDPAGNLTAIRRLAAGACEALEFTPQQGTPGALVTIYGVGFGGQVSGVSFNGVAAVAFFHLQVQLWASQLALSPEAEWVVINELIPVL